LFSTVWNRDRGERVHGSEIHSSGHASPAAR
jgi:hypothetical protein